MVAAGGSLVDDADPVAVAVVSGGTGLGVRSVSGVAVGGGTDLSALGIALADAPAHPAAASDNANAQARRIEPIERVIADSLRFTDMARRSPRRRSRSRCTS
jgi:hypothetical protein